MRIGDQVLVAATREEGMIHRIDRLGSTTLYWLVMSALGGSRTPIDLGGSFTSAELSASRPRR